MPWKCMLLDGMKDGLKLQDGLVSKWQSVSILPAQFPREKHVLLEVVGSTSWKQPSNTSYNKGLCINARTIGFSCFSTGYYVWISFTFSGNSYLYPVHVAEAQLQLPVTCSLLSLTTSCCLLLFPYLSILFPLISFFSLFLPNLQAFIAFYALPSSHFQLPVSISLGQQRYLASHWQGQQEASILPPSVIILSCTKPEVLSKHKKRLPRHS